MRLRRLVLASTAIGLVPAALRAQIPHAEYATRRAALTAGIDSGVYLASLLVVSLGLLRIALFAM